MPRVLQLTDLHLCRDRGLRLKGVPTWETFREVCDHVRNHAEPWDLLVLTGDLAHDELSQTYRLLREELGDWVGRCRIVPGNHDNREGLREAFPEITPRSGEFLTFAEDVGGWRILGLDTHRPGEVSGHLPKEQLNWLAQQLDQSRGPVLLFLHHPPISVHSRWLDRIALEHPEPLRELIAAHPQIRCVAGGHVHHVFQGKIGSADVLTTPSTAIQFEPSGEESSYTNDPPGYRIFDLDETGYRTQVLRLPEMRYRPIAD